MAIYRIYEEGGMHVLGTVVNNTVVGERVFNIGRLRLTGPVNSLYFNLEDIITDVVILSQVIYSDFQKFDGSSWGTQETILTNLNEFFNKSPYKLGESIDVDTSTVQDNYIIQYNSSNKTWEAVSLISQIPSPPPVPVQSVNSKVGNVVLSLNDLSNLNINTPTSNQIISYNSITEKWENVDLPVSSKWDSNGSSIYYNSGNVGIGTANPQSALHLGGTGSLSTGLTFGDGDSGFYEYTNGGIYYVGNGTTRFAFNTLGIASTGSGFMLHRNDSEGTPTYSFIGDTNTGISGNAGVDHLSIVTNGNNRLTVDNVGNVGIGTSTPSAKLHVVGTLRTTQGFAFNGQPVSAVQTGYNTSNVTTTRTFDANNVSLDSLSDVVATLIEDLKIKGIISA